MRNIELNIGGLIGALVLGGIAGAIGFTAFDTASRRPAQVLILGVVVGAVAGNFVWGLVFKKSE